MRKLGEFLLAHQRNAILVAFLCPLLLSLIGISGGHFIAAVVIAFITLRKGPAAGFVVMAWAALAAIGLYAATDYHVIAFAIALITYLFVWGLAYLIRHYRSWPLILEILTVIGLLTVAVLHLAIPDVNQWWAEHLRQYMMNYQRSATMFGLKANEIQKWITTIAPMASGLFYTYLMVPLLIELLLARWWDINVFRGGSLKQEFMFIRLSKLAAGILIALIVLALLKWPYARDALPVIVLMFAVAGLSVLHYAHHMNRQLILLLIVVYIGLVIISDRMAILLALVALVDTWFNLRQRLKQRES